MTYANVVYEYDKCRRARYIHRTHTHTHTQIQKHPEAHIQTLR